MSEALADETGAPTARLIRLYRTWAEGGVGLFVTGNVVVNGAHREGTGNVVVAGDVPLGPFKAWADAAKAHGAVAIVQLNHAGAQTSRFLNPTPTAPSSVAAVKRLAAFGRPREASVAEIETIIERFVHAACAMEAAGFDGVQIHAAHGYLLNQFLSPRFNLRSDEWGGALEGRARVLLRIVRGVRSRVRPSFAVTVKLNSADFQKGGFAEDEALRVAGMLDGEGIDLLELSGGTYERGASFGEGVARSPREAYFLEFARNVRKETRVPLMLTGGFRSRKAMDAALTEGATDIIGLARPIALEPDLPRRLLSDRDAVASELRRRLPWKAVHGLAELAYYGRQLRLVADGGAPNPRLSLACSALSRLASDLAEAIRAPSHARLLSQ